MKIWANTIVNNEENFIWFAIMSVVDWVDKILVWDSGSTDKTVDIIKEIRKIKGNKVDFKEVGLVDKFEFPKVRQQMLDQSDCDWILILDGDEIWWEKSIKKLVDKIKKAVDKIDGIVVPMIVPVGDIYHRQEERAGRYEILDRRGHYSLRAINKKIPGLHVDWPYGRESYFDEHNKPVQGRQNVIFLDTPYLHVTHLRRSSKDDHGKYKYEKGIKFSKNFKYPEVLFKDRPNQVPSPWRKRSKIYEALSLGSLPFRVIKRKLI